MTHPIMKGGELLAELIMMDNTQKIVLLAMFFGFIFAAIYFMWWFIW